MLLDPSRGRRLRWVCDWLPGHASRGLARDCNLCQPCSRFAGKCCYSRLMLQWREWAEREPVRFNRATQAGRHSRLPSACASLETQLGLFATADASRWGLSTQPPTEGAKSSSFCVFQNVPRPSPAATVAEMCNATQSSCGRACARHVLGAFRSRTRAAGIEDSPWCSGFQAE